MRIQGIFTPEGISFGKFNAAKLRQYAKEHPGSRFSLETITPESKEQRGFYHGAVLSLWAYLDGKDYRDNTVLKDLHDIAKREFNGEIFVENGKSHKVGRSTKGVLPEYLDRVIDYLEESYGIDRFQVLDTKRYKHYMDVIYPNPDTPETFIEYMKELNLLK